MRVSAAGKETFWQGDQVQISGRRESYSRIDDDCVAERVFNANASRARENEFPRHRPIFSKWLVGRVLDQQAPEISFGPEITGGHAPVYRGVVALTGFKLIVTLVADVSETWHAHADGLGEQRNLVRTDYDVRSFNPPVRVTIEHSAGFIDL